MIFKKCILNVLIAILFFGHISHITSESRLVNYPKRVYQRCKNFCSKHGETFALIGSMCFIASIIVLGIYGYRTYTARRIERLQEFVRKLFTATGSNVDNNKLDELVEATMSMFSYYSEEHILKILFKRLKDCKMLV